MHIDGDRLSIALQPDVLQALRRYGYEDAGRIAAMVDALLRDALGMHGGGEGRKTEDKPKP